MRDDIFVIETELTQEVLCTLISMSEAWEAEQSCHGYRKNERADIEGNRIFLAKAGDQTVGYLFGHRENTKQSSSVMAENTPVFEVEELYVRPEFRSSGIGTKLFLAAERAVSEEAEYILLSTATKNWRAILHFYIDELGMDFWSARLYLKLR